MTANSASSLLEGLVTRPLSDLKPPAAKALLKMKFNPRARKRINDLSARAQQGALTEAQADELDFYLNLGSLLTILHSKARLALKRTGGARGAAYCD